ncbi:MAG TPA: exopolysaccharide biosynthesis polyprenyl glycosylphosphotransferase [Rhizomicrobium sp.]|jgi:exopolysaccharide biosynthesis polyprenyl glycosylphosphotransferase|nr:exopolysaccharide biosynthesis polyprenyl glycosylphosphotransferase [Rhizomicrobium sp.]
MSIQSGAFSARSALGRLVGAHGAAITQLGRFRVSERGVASLAKLAKARSIGRLTLASPRAIHAHTRDTVCRPKIPNLQVALFPALIAAQPSLAHVDFLSRIPLFFLARRWRPLLKRAEDAVLATLLLTMLCPVFAVLALAVRVDSRGPIYFRQWRRGCNGTEFLIWKFRTMKYEPHSEHTSVQTRRNDPRITKVGRFLRHSSLDELPQLFNVLRGEMSLVGPRPHMAGMLTQDGLPEETIAEYEYRHRVKPGITGWAQVKGLRGAVSNTEQMRQRVALDIYYIENWSLLLDIKILFLTPFKILFDRANAY